MIKYISVFLIGFSSIYFSACNSRLDISNPVIIPADTIVITDGGYYLNATIGNRVFNFRTKNSQTANGVFKDVLGPCISGNHDSTQYSSYFSNVADSGIKEVISFGLIHCVPSDANGYRDSTYLAGTYPIENTKVDTIPVDTARGFINYLDSENVLWSSGLTTKGYGAQKNHSFIITSVQANYDINAALNVTGTFTGWVYNGLGDSLLVSNAKFYSRAWAL